MAPGKTLLSLRGITKRFGSFTALDDVTLDIAAGEIHCLLGENGAGKSTLCNIVFGVHRPDEGEMLLAGQPHRPAAPAEALAQGIAMVHQHFSLVPDLSVIDNLLLGSARGILRRREFARRIEQVSDQYGLSVKPAALIEDLSVGERQRVEIIKCLMREPRLLVLDEPTAVLLPEEIDKLLAVCARVAAEGCSVVLVTHKLAEIRRAAHRATVLRHGRTVARSSSPGEQIAELVRAMIGRDRAEAGTAAPRPQPSSGGLGPGAAGRDAALRLEGLSFRDAQGVLRLSEVDLTVAPGEIVGVAGVEGNGQSELGAILSGMTPATSGRYVFAGRDMTRSPPADVTQAGIGIVPEDRHSVGCVLGMSLAENLFLNQLSGFSRFGLLDRRALRERAKDCMASFDIRARAPDAAFASLSGGNQQKAVLARELGLANLKLLVAAQPTRGLDVGAVDAIYDQIRSAAARGVGVLLISSELDELLGVAHRIAVIYRGRIMGGCDARDENRSLIGAMMAGHET
ncbi:MAG: ABC transporter ATP-binding protein [Parvibaculaceae bacterium]